MSGKSIRGITMSKRMLTLTMVALVVCCAFGVTVWRMAWATPPEGLTSTLLVGPVMFDDIDVRSHTPHYSARIQTRGLSDVYVTQITIAPGGHTGWHSHPGLVLVTVKSGEATEYQGDDPDCTPIVHEAGTGFAEEPGHVHIVRNQGTTNLELVVVFLVPHGSGTRIDEPDPGNCP